MTLEEEFWLLFGNATLNYDYNSWNFTDFPFKFANPIPEIYLTILYYLIGYGFLIIWVISLLGNTLVIVVLLQKKNRNFSTSAYMLALAVADLLVNTFGELHWWLLSHDFIKLTYSTLDCNIRTILINAKNPISVYLQVVISIERVICVLMPHKVKIFCTTSVAQVVIVFIYAVFIAFGAYVSYTVEYKETGRSKIRNCETKKQYWSASETNFYIFIYAYFIIPFLIITLSTCVIIIALFIRRSNMKMKSSKKWKSNSSVTITLVILNSVFFVLVAPQFMLHFVQLTRLVDFNATPELQVYYLFWRDVTNVMNDLNSCVNVFVYFLSGARFRQSVVDLFVSVKTYFAKDVCSCSITEILKKSTTATQSSFIATQD
jgi:hypothetical protein